MRVLFKGAQEVFSGEKGPCFSLLLNTSWNFFGGLFLTLIVVRDDFNPEKKYAKLKNIKN